MRPAGRKIEDINLHHSFPGEFIKGNTNAPDWTSPSLVAPYHGFSDIGAISQLENESERMNMAT